MLLLFLFLYIDCGLLLSMSCAFIPCFHKTEHGGFRSLGILTQELDFRCVMSSLEKPNMQTEQIKAMAALDIG